MLSILISFFISSSHAVMSKSHPYGSMTYNTSNPSSSTPIMTDYSVINSAMRDVRNVLGGGTSDQIRKIAEAKSNAIQNAYTFVQTTNAQTKQIAAQNKQIRKTTVPMTASVSSIDELIQKAQSSGARMGAIHLTDIPDPFWPNTPPFQLGSHAIEMKMLKDTKWVRVHGSENQVGSWVMRKSAIEGLTAEQIRTKFALNFAPTHVSDVHLPKGETLFRGNIQDHGLGGAGQVQYWINKDFRINSEAREWFKNMRELL